MSGQPNTWKKAIALLDRSGRRQFLLVVAVSCSAALSTAVMVASLMPFLTVLAKPEMVIESRFLSALDRILQTDNAFELLRWLGLISIALLILSGGLRILNIYWFE